MTRSQRNNNPGNIVRSHIAWEGMAPGQSSDPRFVVFTSAAYGFRAMARIIHGHWGERSTVAAIITHWAPPSENNTPAYIDRVCGHMGVTADTPLTWGLSAVPLLRAIAIHENNEAPAAVCLWPDSDIIQGIKLEALNIVTDSTAPISAPVSTQESTSQSLSKPAAATSYAPSSSTNASSVGGSLAIVVVAILTQFGVPVSPITAAAIASLCAAVLGYLPKSGRM
jgi:hypothetical protein